MSLLPSQGLPGPPGLQGEMGSEGKGVPGSKVSVTSQTEGLQRRTCVI